MYSCAVRMFIPELLQSTTQHAESAKFLWLSEQFTLFAKQPIWPVGVVTKFTQQQHVGFPIFQSARCAGRARQSVRLTIRVTIRINRQSVRICRHAWNTRTA